MRIKIIQYGKLVKFEHTLFALPFALIGFFLAITHTNAILNWQLFVLVFFCMVTARNAAMAFNRFLDRTYDAENPRTGNREIPAGKIEPVNALYFVFINAILFIIACFFINKPCFYFSPVALFVILGYSYTKRFTPLCHFVLSLGLGIAPTGAYMAVTGRIDTAPLLFSWLVFFWVSAFDIIYACQDTAFDQTSNLKSIPAMLGIRKALWVSRFTHLVTACIVITVGVFLNLHSLYWIGALLFIALLIYQHSIVRHNDLSRVNLAFGTTNGVASLIYAGFTIPSLFLSF